jgi:hypothetical protein
MLKMGKFRAAGNVYVVEVPFCRNYGKHICISIFAKPCRDDSTRQSSLPKSHAHGGPSACMLGRLGVPEVDPTVIFP